MGIEDTTSGVLIRGQNGYAVHVVDQPGRGRAAYEAEIYGPLTRLDLENVQRRFVAPERYNLRNAVLPAVKYLVSQYGKSAVRNVLDLMAQNYNFGNAFKTARKRSILEFDAA